MVDKLRFFINQSFEEFIGAGPFGLNKERRGYRNGG